MPQVNGTGEDGCLASCARTSPLLGLCSPAKLALYSQVYSEIFQRERPVCLLYKKSADAGRCRSWALSCAFLCAFLCALLRPGIIKADTLTVAVASNFAETLQQLAAEFERNSSHQVRLVRGSSGRHFAQIINGAPFDLFLSADAERPRLLLEELQLPVERLHSYAMGKLVLWGTEFESAALTQRALESGKFNTLAMANPRLAPYGQAALESLQAMGIWNALENQAGRVVRGENVAQAFQFVATGNAELGFVALSQVLSSGERAYWLVPEQYYQPIVQQLIVLRENDASLALMRFLESDRAQEIIIHAGYGLSDID